MGKNQQVGTKSRWTTVVALLRTMVGVGKRMMRRLPSLLSRKRRIILKGYTGFFGYNKETEEYTPDAQANSHLLKIIKERQPGKTLWDWLQLLIIPFVLATGGVLFSAQQSQTSLQVSERQHQVDLQIAADQQQETTLKTYLDDMSNLLLNNKLLKSQPGDVVRQVARARTLTTLRRLDAGRNKIVLQFLQDARLIGIKKDAVIDLSNADLSNDDLSGANLSQIDLSGDTLNDTKLNDTKLNYTVLNHADLSKATLNGALLSNTFLNSVILTDADLSGADLAGADLREADLSKATLKGTSLNGAIMRGAILIDADLSNANLTGVDNLTQPQLDEVYSCTNAILSTELKCNRNQ